MKIKGLNKELPPILVGTSSALFTDEMTPWIPTPLTREEQFAAIDQLWDMGLRAYDCASGYGERVLGEYLQKRGRVEEAVILTKGCHPNFYRQRVTPFYLLSDFYDWLFNQDLQVIPLQGGKSPRSFAQTLEAAGMKLRPEEVRWLNLED